MQVKDDAGTRAYAHAIDDFIDWYSSEVPSEPDREDCTASAVTGKSVDVVLPTTGA
jgi:hypothetical protein